MEGAQAMSMAIAVIVGIFVLGTRPPLADTGTDASVPFGKDQKNCVSNEAMN
jgi:hypothetical protein